MTTRREIAVRDATPADANAILQCLGRAFAPYREQYSGDAYLDTVLTPESLRARIAQMQILVAADTSGRVVGTIAYQITDDEGHIRGMAVHPESQGAGVAATLLDVVEIRLKAAGCSSATLDTTRPLERAIRFYEKNGYRPTGAISSFFGMELLAYRKDL